MLLYPGGGGLGRGVMLLYPGGGGLGRGVMLLYPGGGGSRARGYALVPWGGGGLGRGVMLLYAVKPKPSNVVLSVSVCMLSEIITVVIRNHRDQKSS